MGFKAGYAAREWLAERQMNENCGRVAQRYEGSRTVGCPPSQNHQGKELWPGSGEMVVTSVVVTAAAAVVGTGGSADSGSLWIQSNELLLEVELTSFTAHRDFNR